MARMSRKVAKARAMPRKATGKKKRAVAKRGMMKLAPRRSKRPKKAAMVKKARKPGKVSRRKSRAVAVKPSDVVSKSRRKSIRSTIKKTMKKQGMV